MTVEDLRARHFSAALEGRWIDPSQPDRFVTLVTATLIWSW
jgi:hypothetical protein